MILPSLLQKLPRLEDFFFFYEIRNSKFAELTGDNFFFFFFFFVYNLYYKNS